MNKISQLLKRSEVNYTIKPINKIKVVLYRDDEQCDEFFVRTRAKSKLAKLLVLAVGRIITFRKRQCL